MNNYRTFIEDSIIISAGQDTVYVFNKLDGMVVQQLDNSLFRATLKRAPGFFYPTVLSFSEMDTTIVKDTVADTAAVKFLGTSTRKLSGWYTLDVRETIGANSEQIILRTTVYIDPSN